MFRFASAVGLASVLLLVASDASAETQWLQVKTSQLRSAPEFYAPGVLSVHYGDSVETLGEEDGWVRVSVRGKSGYLPVSVLSEKRVVLSNRDAVRVSADPSDVVLAGKGFSKEVEAKYKGADSSLRFDLVDRVERTANVDRKDVGKFVKAGGLKG